MCSLQNISLLIFFCGFDYCVTKINFSFLTSCDDDDDEDDDDVDNDCLDWVFSRLYGQCIWELACVMNFLVICLTRLVE